MCVWLVFNIVCVCALVGAPSDTDACTYNIDMAHEPEGHAREALAGVRQPRDKLPHGLPDQRAHSIVLLRLRLLLAAATLGGAVWIVYFGCFALG